MQLRAMAMARWVLPVPVPPTSTALRCWAMNPPPASSLTRVSLIGVPPNWNGGVDTVGNRFGAGGRDRHQPVGEHRGKDVDHLPIAIVGVGELAPQRSIAAGSTQSLKGAPLRSAPGLRASTGT